MSYRKGFSLIELLIVIAIILIIMTKAMGPLHQTKIQAQETAAVKAISAMHAAQAQFQSQYGRFASTISELAPPISGPATISAAGLIGSDLACGEKGGYRYIVQATESGYTVNANPIAFGSTAATHSTRMRR